MTRLSWIAGAALACGVLDTISVRFVDLPVEKFVAAHGAYRLWFEAMAGPSLLSLPFALVFLSGYAAMAAFAGRPGEWARVSLVVSLAIMAATAAKDELKWMFGRSWPEYWVTKGLFEFKPFAATYVFGSFPSGHTAYIAAPMFVLAWLWPRYKMLWLGVILMVMIGLVGSGYHYVGDVIAGCFVGLAAAAGTISTMGAVARVL